MVLKPSFQIILLIICLAIFGWMGIVVFFVAYYTLGLIPLLLSMIWKDEKGEDECSKIREDLNKIREDLKRFRDNLANAYDSRDPFSLPDPYSTPYGWEYGGDPFDSSSKQKIANDILKILVGKGRNIKYISKDGRLELSFKNIVDEIYHYHGPHQGKPKEIEDDLPF